MVVSTIGYPWIEYAGEWHVTTLHQALFAVRFRPHRLLACVLANFLVLLVFNSARAVETGKNISASRVLYAAGGPIKCLDYHIQSQQLLVAWDSKNKQGKDIDKLELLSLKPDGDAYAVKAQHEIAGEIRRAFLMRSGDIALVHTSLCNDDERLLSPMLHYGNYTRVVLAADLAGGRATLLSMDCRAITVSDDRRCAALLCYPFMETRLDRAAELLLIAAKDNAQPGLPDAWRQISIQWPLNLPLLYPPCWSADGTRAFIYDIDDDDNEDDAVDWRVVREINTDALVAGDGMEPHRRVSSMVREDLKNAVSWDASVPNRVYAIPVYHDAPRNCLFAYVVGGLGEGPRCLIRIDLRAGTEDVVCPLQYSDPNVGWCAESGMPRFSPAGRYVAFAASFYGRVDGIFSRYLVYDRTAGTMHRLGDDRPKEVGKLPFAARIAWASDETLIVASNDKVYEYRIQSR